jgi:hypothetical protein
VLLAFLLQLFKGGCAIDVFRDFGIEEDEVFELAVTQRRECVFVKPSIRDEDRFRA